jgi:hypothetical protein
MDGSVDCHLDGKGGLADRSASSDNEQVSW